MAPQYLTPALQNAAELDWLIDLFAREGVRSYLEIGSRFGGSLWAIGRSLPKGSTIVSVDLPGSKDAREELEACVRRLMSDGYDAKLIFGNSAHDTTKFAVRRAGPFDACLIDGDHTMPGIRNDWEAYGPMCRMVAFHDIAWRRSPEWKEGQRIDVPEFWESIRGQYKWWEEARFCPTGKNNGIGVLWRDSLIPAVGYP